LPGGAAASSEGEQLVEREDPLVEQFFTEEVDASRKDTCLSFATALVVHFDEDPEDDDGCDDEFGFRGHGMGRYT